MIIGFGFGSPLTSILMLLATSLISYGVYRLFSARNQLGRRGREGERDRLLRYYREQRELARKMSQEYDLTDEEIEERVERELDHRRR